ncbi:actin-like ATPase domain-containing protein [Meredithblackwellia eburnea MCA 4105]
MRPAPTYPSSAMAPPRSSSVSEPRPPFSPPPPNHHPHHSPAPSQSSRYAPPTPFQPPQSPYSSSAPSSPSPYVTQNQGHHYASSVYSRNGTLQHQRRLLSSDTNSSVKAAAERMRDREEQTGRLCVGIDFGTTFSGLAFASTRFMSGHIRQILNWPGSMETYRKVPTCIVYSQLSPNEDARIVSWGLEAKNTAVRPGLVKCEWFKLFLSPETVRTGQPDPRLPPLPAGKDAVDVVADFLRCLWTYARGEITGQIGTVADLDAAEVVLTVPAAWDAAGCSFMREAALRANLVQSSRGGDKNWRDRLRIITEPEAAAIHASSISSLHNLQPSQTFIICDAGGGTVDTAVYQLIGQLSSLEIAEMAVRTGSNSGSLFVDLKFEELLRSILKNHPQHLDAQSLASFMHAFSDTDKLNFTGSEEDENSVFRFNCFNPNDAHDPSIGLIWGELCILGSVIRQQVFDPIIDEVLNLLAYQLSKVPGAHVDALILVGGFAASEYLFTRVQRAFGDRIAVIARPNDCDIATLQGAARYGLGVVQGKTGVSHVISPRSYIMKVKLPAETIDYVQRPQFITRNDANMEVCMNRLSYLVEKGAVLKKGKRLRSRFCKYTNGPEDSLFNAVLYCSSTDKIYRYTDEGETQELCRWTADLSVLPDFQRIAAKGGGYVEFDLGLELDSAEVRGT